MCAPSRTGPTGSTTHEPAITAWKASSAPPARRRVKRRENADDRAAIFVNTTRHPVTALAVATAGRLASLIWRLYFGPCSRGAWAGRPGLLRLPWRCFRPGRRPLRRWRIRRLEPVRPSSRTPRITRSAAAFRPTRTTVRCAESSRRRQRRRPAPPRRWLSTRRRAYACRAPSMRRPRPASVSSRAARHQRPDRPTGRAPRG